MNVVRTIVLLVGIVAFVPSASAQSDIVDGSVLHSIFKIQYGEAFGSGFAIEVDGRQYLISAEHVVHGIKAGDSIRLQASESTWQPYRVTAVIHPLESDVDVVALVLPALVAPPSDIVPTFAGALYGQDLYFLGFPDNLVSFLKAGTPIPFVRKGIWSAASGPLIYIDGTTNRGFSGGPVLFQDYKTHQLKFGAIIQGYKDAYVPVLKKSRSDSRPVSEVPLADLHDTGQVIPENAAIVVANSIDPIVEAIRKNPVGLPLKHQR